MKKDQKPSVSDKLHIQLFKKDDIMTEATGLSIMEAAALLHRPLATDEWFKITAHSSGQRLDYDDLIAMLQNTRCGNHDRAYGMVVAVLSETVMEPLVNLDTIYRIFPDYIQIPTLIADWASAFCNTFVLNLTVPEGKIECPPNPYNADHWADLIHRWGVDKIEELEQTHKNAAI